MDDDRLRECVAELVGRPGHEKVRTLLQELLVYGLEASSKDVSFEEPLPVVKGRLDALLGYSVIELKTDLRREQDEGERRLADYIRAKESATGNRHVGILTDGAEFVAYELIHDRLDRTGSHKPSLETPRETLSWLDSVLCLAPDLAPEPARIRLELGRDSVAWHVARNELERLWAELSSHPEATLKRALWSSHLERVYGESVDADDLFFQHTYLSIVAKTIAVHVLGLTIPSPIQLLDGSPFVQAGITGAVEADFFDWLLLSADGPKLVQRIAAQTGRFRFRDVQSDVLKSLYESLIDPAQRHELGEYYTPDWLAHRICREAIDEPLEQRVLDPACGSGTFVFQAVRLFLEAADETGIPNREAVKNCTAKVLGVDIHPLAVQIARVTYLLAIGPDRLADRSHLVVPVYLGDSLQWNKHMFFGTENLAISVPGEAIELKFPLTVAAQPDVFDTIASAMVAMSDQHGSPEGFRNWLKLNTAVTEDEAAELTATYTDFARLHSEGKNHIWAFVARNLARPVWLSEPSQRPDRIVGNPPWLAFRHMSKRIQEEFRAKCVTKQIWVGGNVATQQDLCAYFLARCVELYCKPSTKLAFVMPFAALSRKAYSKFILGDFGQTAGANRVAVTFTEAWTMPDIQPLFPVPSCVLFCTPTESFKSPTRPKNVHEATGMLPFRDAPSDLADKYIEWNETNWPDDNSSVQVSSPYRDRVLNGATLFPRVLIVVEPVPVGRIGANAAAPLVVSNRSNLEKLPWKNVESLQGNVESQFLRPMYIGSSIAPYRVLAPDLAIIPWNNGKLLDVESARRSGFTHLAAWLGKASEIWETKKSVSNRLSWIQQTDFYKKLTSQFPIRPFRVLLAASGTKACACVVEDINGVVEHALYWLEVGSREEGAFICTIVNSETVRRKVADKQARGQWGARHFDKLIFSLPIPKFDPTNPLHVELAELGRQAERIAAAVPLPERIHFIRARSMVRAAIDANPIGQRIEDAVTNLLIGK